MIKPTEDRVRELAESLRFNDPMMAACLTYLVLAAKNDALPLAFTQLGELISSVVQTPASTPSSE